MNGTCGRKKSRGIANRALVRPSYLDANAVIYSVEKHPVYWPPLQPLWLAAKGKTIEIVSNDLTLMESNDAGFRGLASLPLVILDDLLAP